MKSDHLSDSAANHLSLGKVFLQGWVDEVRLNSGREGHMPHHITCIFRDYNLTSLFLSFVLNKSPPTL